jgi:branched-chain amino acid transport system substrate-binding protein
MTSLLRAILSALIVVAYAAVGTLPAGAAGTIRIGAAFPLMSMGGLARQEFTGVQIAADLVNRQGGVDGRRIVLVTRHLDETAQAEPIMKSLRSAGITTVIGAYSSALSIPASAAAARDGLVYWEAGAVADRLTGQGYSSVFRVGASGTNLGSNSARFAATQLAPRLHRSPSRLRVSIVYAQDAYATSVANAAMREASSYHMHVVSRTGYNPYVEYWPPVMAALRKAHPDILILASHIPDGVSFRRQMLADHIHVGAFIGSTMAECGPEFGAMLGPKAVGVFASDRPMGGFNPDALSPTARHLYDRLAVEWKSRTGQTQPTEEAVAGFTAGWVLFHDVLPRTHGRYTSEAIAAAARSLNLPVGSLPNGAGLKFATDRAHLGQNTRAAAVIWQWQAVRHNVVVWPSAYATGHIRFVPLPH